MKQAEFAEKIGWSESTISRVISGDRRPSLDLMLSMKVQFAWSMDSQADCVRAGVYGTKLKERIDAA